MPKKKRRTKGDVAVASALTAVRRAKQEATGVSWRRLHSVESQLETVAGRKPPIRGRGKAAKKKKKKAS